MRPGISSAHLTISVIVKELGTLLNSALRRNVIYRSETFPIAEDSFDVVSGGRHGWVKKVGLLLSSCSVASTPTDGTEWSLGISS